MLRKAKWWRGVAVKHLLSMTRMIVAFFLGFEFGGACDFDIFGFVAFARIVELIAFLLSVSSQRIVESFSGRREFVASFVDRIRPPRKPPDKSSRSILRRVRSLIDCWVWKISQIHFGSKSSVSIHPPIPFKKCSLGAPLVHQQTRRRAKMQKLAQAKGWQV